MTLMTTLKMDLLVARKAKDEIRKNLLTALVGEATSIGKNQGNRETSDEEAIQLVKKFTKNAEETKRICVENNRDTKTVDEELETLSKYVPVQLSETDLISMLTNYKTANEQANLGTAMKYQKENFAGLYDGKIASVIARDIFK